MRQIIHTKIRLNNTLLGILTESKLMKKAEFASLTIKNNGFYDEFILKVNKWACQLIESLELQKLSGGKHMNRKVLTFTLIMAVLIITSLTASIISVVEAADNDYNIERVSHEIEVMHNGYIFINDTIQINGVASSGFLIGFPYKYGSHVLQCEAYNATHVFKVSLNVPLKDRMGFYGAKVDFQQGTPTTFTVGFILSNTLLVQDPANMSHYTLDFPEYPSLIESADVCNVSILLPEGSTYIDGTVANLTYSQESLEAFSEQARPANITFASTEDRIQIVDINELRREITVGGTGEIDCSDIYRITNKDAREIDFFEVILPLNASDQFGKKLGVYNATEKVNRYEVSFRLPLETEESNVFTVKYYLPSEGYIEQKESRSFNLTFPMFQHLDYYIIQSSVTFVLPEGGKIIHLENASFAGVYSITKGVFQEALTINRQGGFSSSGFNVRITYEYDFLWLSFRPTLWMWALTAVGCAITVVWKRSKTIVPVTAPKVAAGISLEDIRSFVDLYERKRKILPRIKALKERTHKGKISRRRSKVQRKTLQTRLGALSKKLADLEKKLRAAGGRYKNLMRRLEVAETEINEVEANIESIEARHSRGELSLEAYRKLLSDYEHRMEKAETTINEILIRLREEIH